MSTFVFLLFTTNKDSMQLFSLLIQSIDDVCIHFCASGVNRSGGVSVHIYKERRRVYVSL